LAPRLLWTGAKNLASTAIRSRTVHAFVPFHQQFVDVCGDYNRAVRKIFRPKRDGGWGGTGRNYTKRNFTI
jgi:hypothetical protein